MGALPAFSQTSLPADEIRIWDEKNEKISLSIRRIRSGVFRLDACIEGPSGTCRAAVFSSEDHTVSVRELTEAEEFFRTLREAHETKGLEPTPLYAEGEKAMNDALDLVLNFQEIKRNAPPEGLSTPKDVTVEITGPMNLAYTAYRMLKAKYGDLDRARRLEPLYPNGFPGLETTRAKSAPEAEVKDPKVDPALPH